MHKLYEDALFYFKEISKIPRPSGHEEKIAAYLVDFAKQHQLSYTTDDTHNVWITKPATSGMEMHAPVLLQGHTDMVCECAPGVVHDFLKEPLDLEEQDGWLFAKGTTLGADDGTAVALMLALLASDHCKHPPLECLFTTCEETGMDGAQGFDYSQVRAKRLINLDSEAEDEITVGCAGSTRLQFVRDVTPMPFSQKALSVNLFGLTGGHSGVEIANGHANAITLLADALLSLYQTQPFQLAEMICDGKDNAIARNCTAVLSVTDLDAAKAHLQAWSQQIRCTLEPYDATFKFHLDRAKKPDMMFSFQDTGKLLRFLSLLPNGVIATVPEMPQMVQTSSNVGILHCDNTGFEIGCLLRSAEKAGMEMLLRKMETLAKLCDFSVQYGAAHPAWTYHKNGNLAEQYQSARKRICGKDTKICIIHAGLECGIIQQALGDLDAISVGPNILDIHTPSERLSLSSFATLCNTVELLLAEL